MHVMGLQDDAKRDTQRSLRDASADLEALRPQASAVIGGTNPEDDPIRNAWAIALARFRVACGKYVDTLA